MKEVTPPAVILTAGFTAAHENYARRRYHVIDNTTFIGGVLRAPPRVKDLGRWIEIGLTAWTP